MNVVDTVGIPLFTTSRHFTSPFEMARVAGGIFRTKANLTAEIAPNSVVERRGEICCLSVKTVIARKVMLDTQNIWKKWIVSFNV